MGGGAAVLQRLAEGQHPALSAADHAVLDSFAGLYGEHLTAEEEVAYPAARSLLDSEATAAMAAEMMRRRGVR